MIQELRILDDETLFDKEAHYVIPRYQRAYAWEDKEIVQLIDDINDSVGDYYIGSLVVAKVKGREERYEVVDGQQRLTTLYLLLNYLVSHNGLEGEVGKTLSFDCRPNSNYTLEHVQDLLSDEKSLIGDEDRLEQSILNGIKAIDQKFMLGAIDVDAFVERLKMVILYLIEVPEHTDLNRYFEIMNTRGEQLEQHDILKAQLMGYLSNRKEQEFFSRVWSACSDMTGYVQMHLAKEEREKIFGSGWNDEPSEDWDDYEECLDMEQGGDHKVLIKSIIKPSFEVDVSDGKLEDDKTKIRFESIIGFPYFLLHVLRVFLSVESISMDEEKELGSLLDDKRLLNDFNEVISHGRMGGKRIKDSRGEFARRFILFLLHSRFLFDQFIIKREYAGDDQEGVWSLKELCTSGAGYKKKAYYANTRLRYENEWEKTYAPRNKECLMIQSALRVSYTSPKVMHWITELLVWLFDDESELPELSGRAERIAAEAVAEGFFEKALEEMGAYDLQEYKSEDYAFGVRTPHIVFNYLDYLLWKDDKERYEDFVFEFRNSVEHWYPQHPSEGTFEVWDGRDTFGNLCIISRSVNSKFSNLSPESKMKSYKKMVQKGSLKLRIMGDIIEGGSSETWRLSECAKHEEEMISLLCEAVQEAIE
ncbi:MAG: DUF262 domain-containing protein, partial [Porphyromonadaceae bacterium]|nr:DUF262 domain-containing protein [Porphyromonadaceae bacterium]